MVSHFHYDPVWWNTQGQFTEARLVLPDEDGSLPDTRTAFDLVRLHLEKARRDPDYKFVLAEIDYLKPHFDAFPQDRAFLRSLLADGRAELVGGTYNEPNTNLTGAETTIRNAVYGMGFQRGVLGADPASAWMLDAFGFDPGFPGLMAAAGLTSSSWARGPFHQWGPAENSRMQFPAEFEWLSPDGTGLLTAYMANHYGAGWTLHTAADLDEALRAAYEQFQPARAGRRDAQRDAARRVRPRDPGPVGDRRRAGVGRQVPLAAVRAGDPARVLRRGARRRGGVARAVLDHAADAGHEPRLHRQGRLLRRHQAGRAGRRGRRTRGRAARHARLAAAAPRTRRSRSTRRGGSSPTARTTTRSPGPSPTRCTWTCSPAGGRRGSGGTRRGGTPSASSPAHAAADTAMPASGGAGLAVTVVNGLARERDGMATVAVTLPSRAPSG